MKKDSESSHAIIASLKLGTPPWPTLDPFLFAVHHDDRYPAANEKLGPAVSLDGRDIGQDFSGKDGWSMYHGRQIPGFPAHPHRGFETVTIVRNGYIDHSDSIGGMARYGAGDVQWLTAGRGIQHAEMFPLLEQAAPNPVELFQIWLNLPGAKKMTEPVFAMLWAEKIPRQVMKDARGLASEVMLVAGKLGPTNALSPPPMSRAAEANADVAIWTIKMDPGASCSLPGADRESNRVLYFFRGRELRMAGTTFTAPHAIQLRAEVPIELTAGNEEVEILMLQGRPIGEPVVQHGPFVMNTREEIEQAFADYRKTNFGAWPWKSPDPVHERLAGRFAQYPDKRIEKPKGSG